MAYYTQEMKKAVAPKIKEVLKKYGLKGSLSVRDYHEVVLTIKEGTLDLLVGSGGREYMDVNCYYLGNQFSGDALKAITELHTILNEGNHNNSDSQSDYFDVGFYVSIKIGSWDKPYNLTW